MSGSYTKNDTIIFVLQPTEGSIYRPKILQVVSELTEAGWQIPYSTRVDSIANFQHTQAEDDDLIVADLIADAGALGSAEIEEIRSIVRAEPLLHGRLVAKNERTTGVNVRLQVPGKSLTEIPQAVAHARNLAADLREKHPDLRVEISGSGMLSTAFSEAPQRDIGFLIPLMYAILTIAILIALRSFSATLATVGVVILAALSAMGVAGWVGIALNGISASAPTVILTLRYR